MKILHYINNLGSGGAEKLLTDILPLMRDKGHEIHLVYCNNKKNVARYDEMLCHAGITVYNLKTSFYNPLQVISLMRLMKTERYDIVHAHLFPTQYWLAFAAFFKPSMTKLVKTEHSVFNNRRKYALLSFLEKIVYGRYAKIIAITDEVKSSLEKWLKNSARIQVIYNGVNLRQIQEQQAKEVPEKYNMGKSPRINLLMVGRFSGVAKDQDTLIRALSILPPEYHLYFAGEGSYLEVSRKLAEDLHLSDRIHFLGLCTDVYLLMNKVDINVLSTNYEGLSGVALESMASGKPFIGSDVPGINNVVPNDFYLFPKQNPERLAHKVKSIMADEQLAKSMAETAVNHVQQYDINRMVDQYLALYESIGSK